MSKKTYKVVKGYYELTSSEKREVRDAIKKIDDKEYDFQKQDIVKAMSESVGPLDSNNCPCCGK